MNLKVQHDDVGDGVIKVPSKWVIIAAALVFGGPAASNLALSTMFPNTAFRPDPATGSAVSAALTQLDKRHLQMHCMLATMIRSGMPPLKTAEAISSAQAFLERKFPGEYIRPSFSYNDPESVTHDCKALIENFGSFDVPKMDSVPLR